MLVPSNILLKKYGAKRLLPILMITCKSNLLVLLAFIITCSWVVLTFNEGGMIVMAIAASKNAAGLIVARFFLGVPESGVGKRTTIFV